LNAKSLVETRHSGQLPTNSRILLAGEAFVESYADRDCALSTSRMKPGHVGKKLDDPTRFSHLG
jgi:hypothetical protein